MGGLCCNTSPRHRGTAHRRRPARSSSAARQGARREALPFPMTRSSSRDSSTSRSTGWLGSGVDGGSAPTRRSTEWRDDALRSEKRRHTTGVSGSVGSRVDGRVRLHAGRSTDSPGPRPAPSCSGRHQGAARESTPRSVSRPAGPTGAGRVCQWIRRTALPAAPLHDLPRGVLRC